MEKVYFDSYGQVIRDYFREFRRAFHKENICFLLLFLGLGIIAAAGDGVGKFRMDLEAMNWVTGIPIFYALASGVLHTVSLPFMIYLIPCSRKQRERYIQRMLMVKIAIPIAFGAICDVAVFCMGDISLYVFVLQMASVFFISSLFGMLHDDGVYAAENKVAYGELRPFTAALMVMCHLFGTAMFVICVGAVGKVGFWVILSVMVFVLLPILVTVWKRWGQIRRNFADYETAAERIE